MKPVRLPASATSTLPRLGLFVLCLLYILPGLIGRDPWKLGSDAASFGVMWTMAHGSFSDWLWPNVVGQPIPAEGPLVFWIGAFFIKLFGWLIGDDNAARMANILFLYVGSTSIWHATYCLGRRLEAQPLQLAFGGQPEPIDFGRTLADGALLIYLGSLGLLIHSHLSSAVALQISLVALVIYIAIRLFDVDTEFDVPTKKYAVLLGVTLGLLILTRGWLTPLVLWLTCLSLAIFRFKKLATYITLISLPSALAVASIWLLTCKFIQPFDGSPYSAWMDWNKQGFFRPSYNSIHFLIKYSAWFVWPAWPFAGWAVYAWRKQLTALHITLPLSFFIGLLILVLCSPYADQTDLIPLIPPLSILAAFGLPTMKRGGINAVDWFSVMVFSILAIYIWLSWIAMQTGWPVQLNRNVLKSVPGFKAQFELLPFAIALASTIAWLKLVKWRISRQPRVLWRAVVLSSSGVILCWLLSMTLWTPWLNYRVSYQPMAQEIKRQLNESYRCVDSNISAAQRASLAYLGNIRFSTFDTKECDYFLTEKHQRKNPNYPESEPIWEGHRASDKSERFSLYKLESKDK